MDPQGAAGPVDVSCPGCGSTDVRTVEQAQTGKRAIRDGLHSRLAPEPDKTGDGCMHFAEGMVLTALGVGLVYTGVQQEKPLYVIGGAVLALVCFFGTFFVVRGDRGEEAAALAGMPLAEPLWRPAHYCVGCTSVFCPGNTPWRGTLTPEQFKKLVWTQAGCADQLPAGDKAKDAQIPEGVLPNA
ncbi:hypothetical protein IPZ68_10910 [Streptomyces arenae]|nr:hypothetical protein [Streptomyces arenae]